MPDFKISYSKYWEELACSSLILLFLYAAISKVADISLFKHQLSLQPFPDWLNATLLFAVPVGELLVVLLLFIQTTRFIGLIAAATLLTVFTIYIVLILLKFWDHVPCDCGGMISWLGWKIHLWFNLFFLTLSIIGIYSSNERRPAFKA